jgi:ferredoxin-type protein NapH
MADSMRAFYKGPYRYLSLLFIITVAVGGYFQPLVGLAVPALILTALISNTRSSRYFCANLCPNGRLLSSSLSAVSKRRRLPPFIYSVQARRALCGLMFFCVINLLVRFGGGIEQFARVFWGVYILSIGISFTMGSWFKPRSWCAVCPVGTLQDTISSGRRRKTPV